MQMNEDILLNKQVIEMVACCSLVNVSQNRINATHRNSTQGPMAESSSNIPALKIWELWIVSMAYSQGLIYIL